MTGLEIIKISFKTLLKKKKAQNIESKSLEDADIEKEGCDTLVTNQDKKRIITVSDITYEMIRVDYSRLRIIIDPMGDTKLVLDLKHINCISSLSRSTVHDC